MKQEEVIVLDFGGQYTQLIAKAVRKCNVFSEILDCESSLEDILKREPKGIILSGGPDSVYEEGAPSVNPEIFDSGIPLLGICYGMQLINHLLGGNILHSTYVEGEYGDTNIKLCTANPLFDGIDKNIVVRMSHGDSVNKAKIPKGFEVIAMTNLHVAGIADDLRRIYGVQFHPEVTHTQQGLDIVSNFVHNICGCGSEWTMANYIEETKRYIRETVGKNDVVSFVSGGVDSSFVTTVLAQTEGIGNVYPIYIGALMRKYENEEVVASLQRAGVKNLKFIDAEKRFIDVIRSMRDPEQKRKAIGNLFGVIMGEVCEELSLNPETTYLAQGTLYTDLIESGKGVGKKAAIIKSHHNAGCKFIDDLKSKGMVVEPNRLIFKDEVRIAAREIGLPHEISERQPYPGPGLGIRIIDHSKTWTDSLILKQFSREYRNFRRINKQVQKIAKQRELEGYVVPIKTVGVQGDARTYSYLAVLRGERDWKNIRSAAVEIPIEVKQVNRIVYDIGQKEQRLLNRELVMPCTVDEVTVNLLKDTDYEGKKILDKYGFSDNIAQIIFVLFGADMYSTGQRSVALRAVQTDDFMTVSPVPIDNINLSWNCLDEIRQNLLVHYDIGAFVYDVTDKPPATTCWE
jgi:GMP synthase (glutamine-hydrolysing)